MSTDESWGQVLNEPMPCDQCEHAELCRFTGSACRAFAAYVRGEAWEHLAREPSVRTGEKLGLKAAAMSDADRERLLARVMWE